jgi:hypothetical protein
MGKSILRKSGWALLGALALSACGGGSDMQTESGTGAISAPAGAWTWVPVEGARCASGTTTGIGVRLQPGARQLMLFLDGGGACTSYENCWGSNRGAANVEGYGAADFAAEGKLTNYSLFDTAAGTANPFASMHMVMVPYCTGDVHIGRATRTLVSGGNSRVTSFNGAINVEQALARLAVTFPSLDAVWLVGTSAGGGGVTHHHINVRNALRTTVHTVIDSLLALDDGDESEKAGIWGVTAPCASCTTMAATRAYNRSLNSTERFGFLSFRYDQTTANGRDEATFDRDLKALVAQYQSWPATRTFIADNSATGFGPPNLHVVTNRKTPVALMNAYYDFLGDMVANQGWQNVVIAP